uniref:BHLH domain-containing protein n=1 Tax=Glycine max TaxID=3847 RepID=C6TH80_SOYBN|nr:unknown [Glycine max]
MLLRVKRTPRRGILSVTFEVMHYMKMGHADSSCQVGSKACREKLRRERLNERFCDLSSVLEPGRPVRTDKPAILDDAIRVLSQLKTEAQELKKTNEKLLEEIKCLKAEKNELREEKLVLKADKERIEKQLKALPVAPAGYMTPPVAAAAYQAGVNKMALYPNYGYIPNVAISSSICQRHIS